MQKKQIVIDKRTLELILNDQKTEIEGWTDKFLCSRNEERLVDLGSPQAQVVIGVRRCGKSTLCMQTLTGAGLKFAYADFDDERLDGLDTAQLNDVLEVLYKIYGSFQYIFLDEIQNIEGWPLFVNELNKNKDEYKDYKTLDDITFLLLFKNENYLLQVVEKLPNIICKQNSSYSSTEPKQTINLLQLELRDLDDEYPNRKV